MKNLKENWLNSGTQWNLGPKLETAEEHCSTPPSQHICWNVEVLFPHHLKTPGVKNWRQKLDISKGPEWSYSCQKTLGYNSIDDVDGVKCNKTLKRILNQWREHFWATFTRLHTPELRIFFTRFSRKLPSFGVLIHASLAPFSWLRWMD